MKRIHATINTSMKYIHSRFAAFSLLLVAVAVLGAIVIGHPALAAECGGVDTSVVDCSSTNDTTGSGVIAILVLAIQILTGLVGVVAIGALVYAGVLYTSASSNAAQVTKAKDMIRNTIIGLVVFAVMALGLNYLIPGGLFSGNTKFGAGGNGKSAIELSALAERPKLIGSDDDEASTSSNNSMKNIAGECYNVKVSKADIATKDRFHISGSQPYALENSLEGIDYAAKHGYKAIDIDTMVTKDGVPVGTHAWEPLQSGKKGGFKDTAGKIKDKNIRISGMTLAEVRRLKHKDGYRISTLEELMIHAKQKGINLIIEMKVPERILKLNLLPKIAALLNKYKVKAGITSRKDKTDYAKALKTARSLGFLTRMASSPGASKKDRTWIGPERDASLCSKLGG